MPTTKDFITLSSYPRAIIHVDCDAFFASCEAARDPALKGKPIATGAERGIVSCPSYEAKKRGVKRGVRLSEAKKHCPELIILPSDYELYSIYSRRLFTILRRFTPDVEEYSIDEAFCDLTGLRRLYRTSYEEIATKIKNTVHQELDITVSIGLSLSKILAKLCSKQNKPNGFCAVPGHELHIFLKKIPLERVCGFGSSTVALLHKYRIISVLDYVRQPEKFAAKLLGKIGIDLWHELRGVAVYPFLMEKKETYTTISKTKTFMPPSADKNTVRGQLIRNLESAFIKLRRYSLSARTLIVYLRKADFDSAGFEGRLTRHSSSTLDFSNLCIELFNQIFEEGTTYRATGVILSDITDDGIDNADLFDDPVKIERMRRASAVIDEINERYGKHTIHLATSHAVGTKKKHPRSTDSWRKKALLPGESFRKRLGIPLLKLGGQSL
jgi:DNA polymerase IV